MPTQRHTKYFIITEFVAGCLPDDPNSYRIAYTHDDLRTELAESREYFGQSEIRYDVITPVNEVLKLKPGQSTIYVQGDNLWTVQVECVSAIEQEEYLSRVADHFNDDYTFVNDTQDLEALYQSEAGPYIRGFAGNLASITAAFVRVGDGEYAEIWVTESNTPHHRTTSFSCVFGCGSATTGETESLKPRYILTQWRSDDNLSSNDIMSFMDKLDSHIAEFEDSNWDSFWGGDIYVHLWDEQGFREVNPADLIVGAYIAADELNHRLFDRLYRRWLTPSPLGVSLKTEDESVKEVYDFVMDELSRSKDKEPSVMNLDADNCSELHHEQAVEPEDDDASPYESVIDVIELIFDALVYDSEDHIGLIRKGASEHQRDLIDLIVDESNTLGYAKGWRYNQLHTLALEARYVVHPIYINDEFDIIDSCADILRPDSSMIDLLNWVNDEETDSLIVTDIDDVLADHAAGLMDSALDSFHSLLEDAQNSVLRRILQAFASVVWDEFQNPSKPDSDAEKNDVLIDDRPQDGAGDSEPPTDTLDYSPSHLYRVRVYDKAGRFIETYATSEEAVAAAHAAQVDNLACVQRSDQTLVYRNDLWRSLYPDAYDLETCLGYIIRSEQSRHQLTKQRLASVSDEANALQRKVNDLDPTYNGYSNRSTWLTSLWLDNDYGLYALLQEWADEVEHQFQLADRVKDLIEEGNPLAEDASIYADLLGYAIAIVDYHEVVESYWQERNAEDASADGISEYQMNWTFEPVYQGYASSDEFQFKIQIEDIDLLKERSFKKIETDDKATIITKDRELAEQLLVRIAQNISDSTSDDYKVMVALGLIDLTGDMMPVAVYMDAETVFVLQWTIDHDAILYIRTLVKAARREMKGSDPHQKASQWVYEYLHKDKGLVVTFSVAQTIASAILTELPGKEH